MRFKSCPNNCAYHARCIDLLSIRQKAASNALGTLSTCPTCGLSCTGIEMIPLSFVEIDSAQRLSGFNKKPSSGSGGGAPSSSPSNGPNKRTHSDVMMDVTSTDTKSQNTTTSFYDPANPRTGKWSDEEIAFRDSLVPLFVDGSLPLTSGLKLIDFLSSMLKSKPSRLTKKMKHAKLSTRHFRLDSGYIRDTNRASEVSRLESAFVNSISDPVERSEIKFHMQKEWRDHLAERFTFLRISFHAEEWLKSVDVMDRRITLAKSRNRMVKRRFMMGKAMEKDTSSPTPGIFIDSTVDNGAQDDEVDFELLASALETNDAEDADLRALYSSMADDSSTPQIGTADGPSVMPTPNIMGPMNMMGGNSKGVQGGVLDESGHSKLSKTSGVSGKTSDTSSNGAAETPFRSALLPSLGSAEGPNFRFAAPFLAKVTAYIEHNRVPFEHVDIWVPSSSNGFNLDPTGATAPEPTVLGSGSAGNNNSNSSIAAVSTQCPVGRLCFAGSASVGVQIVDDAELKQEDHGIQPFDHKMHGQNHKAVPLSSDEIYHLSLFGSYSEKFSFSSGCGLPGRVYESAVPAWEQFIANAPSHLFERRGGAMQFGIKTALGLPIRSPNVGRIVLVLYSKHNREKNDELVGQMVRDFQVLNPSPRWKLMVDMGNNYTAQPTNDTNDTVMGEANVNGAGQAMGGLSAAMAGLSEKNVQISDVISMCKSSLHVIFVLVLMLLLFMPVLTQPIPI